jgi:lysophospholipase L1-like esterase
MLDCLILGDSIAVGVGQAKPGCTTVAQTGIGSGTFLQTLFPAAPKTASHVIISLGVNDDPAAATLTNLRRLRSTVAAGRVTWLLPGLKEEVRRYIRTAAAERGDRVVDTISQVGPDHLHPGRDGYRLIAGWVDGAPVGLPGGTRAGTAAIAPAPSRLASGSMLNPVLVPVPGSNAGSAGLLPQVHTPGSIYGAVTAGPFAAIPPRDYAYRAFAWPSLPRSQPMPPPLLQPLPQKLPLPLPAKGY